MTPGATAGFRAFLKLSDIANGDEPEAVFSAMARIAAWSYRQTKESNPALDELLTPLSDQTSLWMGLLLHLATIDFHFFHLAKRMAARTLVRHDPPAKRYREMAAALLVSDPPSRRKPKLATHVALIIGVTVGRTWMETNRGQPQTQAEGAEWMWKDGGGLGTLWGRNRLQWNRKGMESQGGYFAFSWFLWGRRIGLFSDCFSDEITPDRDDKSASETTGVHHAIRQAVTSRGRSRENP